MNNLTASPIGLTAIGLIVLILGTLVTVFNLRYIFSLAGKNASVSKKILATFPLGNFTGMVLGILIYVITSDGYLSLLPLSIIFLFYSTIIFRKPDDAAWICQDSGWIFYTNYGGLTGPYSARDFINFSRVELPLSLLFVVMLVYLVIT